MCVCVCVCVRVCVCFTSLTYGSHAVFVAWRFSASVCVWGGERVCVREKERERERVYVCVRERRVCVYMNIRFRRLAVL